MLGIPGLSILVFFLILVPSTILGYVKGWRGAIFVSLVLLVFTMIWVLIGYLLYDSLLWGLYRDHIIKKPATPLDLDHLKNTFEVRVILLFAGILTPFSYLFVFLIWKLLGEKINRYMGPKTKETDKAYKKEIIYRKSAKPSRIGGAIIMGGSTLFISSMAASAVSVLTVPYKDRNGFTDFNDTLGKFYGLGQIGNPEDAAAIEAFIEKIDKDMTDGIQELANIGSFKSTRTNDNFVPSASIIKTKLSGEVLKALNNLMATQEEAAAGIFKLILESNTNQPVNDPLRWDAKTNTDGTDAITGNQIGYSEARSYDLNKLKTEFDANPIAITLTPKVIDALVAYFKSRMVDYEKTDFAKQYHRALASLAAAKAKLAEKRNNYTTQKATLQGAQNELASLIKRSLAINGQAYNVADNSDVTLAEALSYKSYTAPTSNVVIGGTELDLANKVVTRTTHEYDAYVPTYNKAVADYKTANDKFEANKIREASLRETARLSQKAYNTAVSEKTDEERKMNEAVARQTYLEGEIRNLDTQITNSQSEQTRVSGIKSTLDHTIATNQTELTGIPGKLSPLEIQKGNIENDIAQLNHRLVSAVDAGVITQIKADLAAKEQALTAVKNNITTLTSRKTELERLIRENTATSNSYKTNLEQIAIKLGSDKSTKRGHEIEVASLKMQIASHKTRIGTLTTSIAQKLIKSNSDRTAHQTFVNGDLRTSREEVDRLAGPLAIAKNEYARLTQNKTSAIQHRDALVDEIASIKTKVLEKMTITHTSVTKIKELLSLAWSTTSTDQTTASLGSDDGSIKYSIWKVKYQETVAKNCLDIYKEKATVYQNTANKLIELYSSWLRKVK